MDVKPAPAAVSADANGRTLIVVSESVQPTDVAAKFTNAPVPIVTPAMIVAPEPIEAPRHTRVA